MNSDKTSHHNVAQLALLAEADAVEDPLADVARAMSPSYNGHIHKPQIPDQIHIERLILHKIDHFSMTKDLADDLSTYEEDTRILFVEHIRRVLRESQWGARFEDEDGPISSLCKQLLDTTEEFILSSKQLAVHLLGAMFTPNITRGDFVAAIYRHDNETTRRIAIFKLDMETRQVRDVDRVGDKTRINIRKNDGVLSTPNSKDFTKCALLTPMEVVDTDGNLVTRFHIQLLDAQAGPRSSSGIAVYFFRRFLQAVLEPNARRHTREFLRVTGEFISQHENSVTDEDREKFYDARREALSTALENDDPALEVDQFVRAALPNHAELQDQLISDLTHAILPTFAPAESAIRSFSIDADVARPFVHKVILEIDHNVRLIFPAELFGTMVKIERDSNESLHRIVIETHNYRQREY